MSAHLGHMGQPAASPRSGGLVGPLRNGNFRGDPNAAPRCGARARTTGCPCRAPAMKNGRCRMHGGKCTGPRTEAGMARMIAANTTHGRYAAAGAPQRARERWARTLVGRIRLLVRATALEPYLTPAEAARLAQYPPELRGPMHPSQVAFEAACAANACTARHRALDPMVRGGGGPALRVRETERAAAVAEAAALAPWRAAIAAARVARRAAWAARREAREARRAARGGGRRAESGEMLAARSYPRAKSPGACALQSLPPGTGPGGEIALRAAGMRGVVPSPGSLRDPTPGTSPGACLAHSSRPKPAERERCTSGAAGSDALQHESPGAGIPSGSSPGGPEDKSPAAPGPARQNPTMALALGTTALANPWALLELRAELDARFGHIRPPGWHVLQAPPLSLDAMLDDICARLCRAP